MLATLVLEEAPQTDLGWLIWVALIIFVVVVAIGWWASGRQQTEEAESAPAEDAELDDLTKLEGIGPKVSQVLAGAGITTFAQLANADKAKVEEALKAAGLQMMDPSGWIEQAALAAKGDWDALSKLQDELKGGRRV